MIPARPALSPSAVDGRPALAFACRLAWWMIVWAGLLACVPPALAHDGQPPAPQTLWRHWHWEPMIVTGLALSGAVYQGGRRLFWRQVAGGRLARSWKKTLTWRALCFYAGLGVAGLALLSPLDSLSLVLFSAHMGQHMALALAAAPLLVLGDPLPVFILIFPTRVRRAIGRRWNRARWMRPGWRALSHPAAVWGLHALALWAWHVPVLYQAALESELVHGLEHGSLLGTALLFWWTIVSPRRGRRSRAPGVDGGLGVLYLFTTALQSGLLGVLITFASQPWYEAYTASAPAWGLSPLEDQQLAGVLMWIAAGLVYVLAALAVFMTWLRDIEQHHRPSPRHATPPQLLVSQPAAAVED